MGATGWDAGYNTNWPMEAAQGSKCYIQKAEPDLKFIDFPIAVYTLASEVVLIY